MEGNFRIAVIRFPRLVAVLLLVVWLGACASRRPKPVDPTLSKAEEQQRKALQQCRRYRGKSSAAESTLLGHQEAPAGDCGGALCARDATAAP